MISKLLHPALVKLIRLNAYAQFRRTLRGLKTIRGAVFFIVAILWFGLMIFPNLMMVSQIGRTDPETVRTVLPMILFGICLIQLISSGWEKALQFKMSEVDFLFPAPFTRRELLIYKILGGLGGTVFVSLLFSAIFLRHSTLWIASVGGFFFSFLFIGFFGMIMILLKQMITAQAYTVTRIVMIVSVLLLFGLTVWNEILTVFETGILQFLQQFRESSAGKVILFPFMILANTITAEKFFPDFVKWCSAAFFMNLLLFLIIVRLDSNYMEASVTISQKLYERKQRVQRGQAWSNFGRSRSVQWHIPAFPWLGGAGPIAWRQITHIMRNMGGMLFFFILMCVILAPSFLWEDRDQPEFFSILVGLIAWLTFIFTSSLPFGFRSDLDHMDWFKMLPLSSIAIVLGQISGIVLFLTALQYILFLFTCIIIPESIVPMIVAACFAIPFNGILIGMDNCLILLFPVRLVQTGPGDFQNFGRQMVYFLFKTLALMCGLAIAAGFGFLFYWIFGKSWTILFLIAWLILMLETVWITITTAWAFDHFDLSVDTPA